MILAPLPYGHTTKGAAIDRYLLRNAHGIEVELISLGAAIAALRVPDRAGHFADVVLGYDTLAEWETGRAHHGAIVGRFGNRIFQGRFSLDGRTYAIPTNDGGINALHGGGGDGAFHWKPWTATPVEDGVRFRLVSPDGENGFPGTLTADVTYTLNDANQLRLDYRVETDAPTIHNLTNHAYFNLAGEGGDSILDHIIRLNASHYTPIHAALVPTGEIAPVEGTPLDLCRPTRIGARIGEDFPALTLAGGYDHNFVVDGEGLREVAAVLEPTSGRTLTVHSTEPGVQFYSGNFLRGENGKSGHLYPARSAFCLETQHFPDSPNQPHFPTTVLRPGEVYASTTIFAFGVSPAPDAFVV